MVRGPGSRWVPAGVGHEGGERYGQRIPNYQRRYQHEDHSEQAGADGEQVRRCLRRNDERDLRGARALMRVLSLLRAARSASNCYVPLSSCCKRTGRDNGRFAWVSSGSAGLVHHTVASWLT